VKWHGSGVMASMAKAKKSEEENEMKNGVNDEISAKNEEKWSAAKSKMKKPGEESEIAVAAAYGEESHESLSANISS
jgi:hypothetical protein